MSELCACFVSTFSVLYFLVTDRDHIVYLRLYIPPPP